MRREINFLVVGVVVCLVSVVSAGEYGGGLGTEADPYRIWDVNDLNEIAHNAYDWDKHFLLMTDIDAEGGILNTISSQPVFKIPPDPPEPIGFVGVFDGNGHVIENIGGFQIVGPLFWEDAQGLFAYVTGTGVVMNLGLENVDIDFVAYSALSSYNGILVGYNSGTIVDCYVTGRAEKASGGTVGGLVGHNAGTISNCYSLCDVEVNYISFELTNVNVGGFAGRNQGTISSCYSAGTVTGTNSSEGSLWVGGFTGVEAGTSEKCFWDEEASGVDVAYGYLSTWPEDPDAVHEIYGMTTEQMMQLVTFVSWIMEEGWTIDEGNDRPHLLWEGKPGELIALETVWEGEGTELDPFCIDSAAGLAALGHVSATYWRDYRHYLLTADIDLSGVGEGVIKAIGYIDDTGQWPFMGVFDGANHVVSGLSINRPEDDWIGMFGYGQGELKNLRLEDVNITGHDSVGALAGRNFGAVYNCHVTGQVNGHFHVGGLVGEGVGCGKSSVEGTVTGTAYVGGLVGVNNGLIKECFSNIYVSGGGEVGGLIGRNLGGTSSCYSNGTVEGNSAVGGLIGYDTSGEELNDSCYAACTVTGSENVGGFIGTDSEPRIVNCFWDLDVSGQTEGIGSTSDPQALQGLPTVQMQQLETYIVWFEKDAWTIEDGVDWPRLAWEGKDGVQIGPSGFWQGSGSENDPYTIDSAIGFIGVAYCPTLWDKCYMLACDIDLSLVTEVAFKSIGVIPCLGGDPEIPFQGVFDGGGHTIKGFDIEPHPECLWRSMFGYVGEEGIVRNLTIGDSDAPSEPLGCSLVELNEGLVFGCEAFGTIEYTSALLVCHNSGIVRNCFCAGSVDSPEYMRHSFECVGGLVGSNGWEATVADSHSAVSVLGTSRVGGLVGYNYDGYVLNCSATGRVTAEGASAGGLIGYSTGGGEWGIVSNCFATGDVEALYAAGGLIGNNWGIINNCYALGSVTATVDLGGGLCGRNLEGNISRCYSAGLVSGNGYLGGFCGYQYGDYAEIQSSFWDTETSGMPDGMGNLEPDPNGVMGLTTTQMQTQSTFTDYGWDFVGEDVNGTDDIWRMCVDGVYYPKLWWQYSTFGDFACPDGVGIEDLLMLTEYWLETGLEPLAVPDATGDGQINLDDFAITSQNWLEEN